MIGNNISYIFLLIQAIACIAFSAKCPLPDAVSPCSCHDDEEDVDVVLYCSDDDTNLDQVKNALASLSGQSSIAVELDGLNLGSVPFNFFSGYNVKRLEISHCELDSLAESGGKPLEGLEDSLEVLIIASSFSEDTESANFVISHLRKLKELDITYNTITEMGNDWFKDAPATLRHLTLSNNGIESIGDRVFADLTNVERLALHGNRFGPILRSMFPNPANELDTLELDNNALTSLPADIFSNMPYLKVITLTNNGLRQLPEEVWKTNWNTLDVIDLRGNVLECDSHMEWMSKVPTCADIAAKCNFPREKAGKYVPFVRDTSCAFHF